MRKAAAIKGPGASPLCLQAAGSRRGAAGASAASASSFHSAASRFSVAGLGAKPLLRSTGPGQLPFGPFGFSKAEDPLDRLYIQTSLYL